ncbi:MAG: hypothetical protein OCD02_05175 [Spirochaetaceae bacterium]
MGGSRGRLISTERRKSAVALITTATEAGARLREGLQGDGNINEFL